MIQNHRNRLPQLNGELFLTDAGLETWLVFQRNCALREFAAFELLCSENGQALLRDYYVPFLQMAQRESCGFVLETPTWRASPEWGEKLGYDLDQIALINRCAVSFIAELREQYGRNGTVLLSGNMGPRGDGYEAGDVMSACEAEKFHALQVEAFKSSDADLVSAITMTNTPEAIGIARAAASRDIPCVISFTVETDGYLPSGQTLCEAIEETDDACSVAPVYYMINCAHPDHFRQELNNGAAWTQRIGGLRANASRMSHAELDMAEELDDGDPVELAGLYSELRRLLPNLSVVGGCCGTDHRHVEQICTAYRQAA